MLSLTFLCLSGIAIDRDPHATLKVVSDARASDLAAINDGRFTFAVTEDHSANAAEARKGNIHEPVFSHIVYEFGNGLRLYIHSYEEADVIRGTTVLTENSTSTKYNPFQMATNGSLTIYDGINLAPGETRLKHRAFIQKDAGMFSQRYGLPLNVGMPRRNGNNLGMDFESARVTPAATKLENLTDDAQFEGRRVCKLSLRTSRGERTYWVDAARGSLPLQRLDRMQNGSELQLNYDDIQRFAGNVWLPKILTVYRSTSKKATRYEMKRCEINVNPNLAAETISFPDAIEIPDTVNRRTYAKTTKFKLGNLNSP